MGCGAAADARGVCNHRACCPIICPSGCEVVRCLTQVHWDNYMLMIRAIGWGMGAVQSQLFKDIEDIASFIRNKTTTAEAKFTSLLHPTTKL